MKLVEMRVSNYKGIHGELEDNKISFDQGNILFLVGQNNVGKSSFLRAYEFFYSSAQKADIKDFFNYDVTTPIIIEADFIVEETDNTDRDLEGEPDWINKWVQTGTRLVTVKKVWTRADTLFDRFTKKQDGEWVPNGFGGFHTKLTKYIPEPIFVTAIQTEKDLEDQVNRLIEKQFLKSLESTHEAEYRAAREAIEVLQNRLDENPEIQSLNERMNQRFQQIFPTLRLKISPKSSDGIEIIKAFKTNHSIDILKDGFDRKETFDQQGHGVIRQVFFNFLTFLKDRDPGQRKRYLLLLEEPELFLHPKSERLVREQLYSLSENSPFQILCATHSAQMIDISKPHSSIIRVTKDLATERTLVHQAGQSLFFGSDSMRNFVQMINSFDPNICEIFYSSQVIIIEGATEAVVIREILKKYFPQEDTFIFNAGTKNNMPFLLDILGHFKISYTVIHDSDSRFVYLNRSNAEVRRNSDGGPRANSAWAFNAQIWDKIVAHRVAGVVANRCVSIFDFEHENNYEVNNSIGKPMSAYLFVADHLEIQNTSIFKFVQAIIQNDYPDHLYSQNWLEANVIEPLQDSPLPEV